QSLREELAHTRALQQDEAAALKKKIAGLETEQANVLAQLHGQQTRVELANAALGRASQLVAQGFISQEMLQQKQADVLDQAGRSQARERDRISLGRAWQGQRADLQDLPWRQQPQLAQMERLLPSTGQEWTESEARRQTAVLAPQSGVVTALIVQ